jgi:hypothetical protein
VWCVVDPRRPRRAVVMSPHDRTASRRIPQLVDEDQGDDADPRTFAKAMCRSSTRTRTPPVASRQASTVPLHRFPLFQPGQRLGARQVGAGRAGLEGIRAGNTGKHHKGFPSSVRQRHPSCTRSTARRTLLPSRRPRRPPGHGARHPHASGHAPSPSRENREEQRRTRAARRAAPGTASYGSRRQPHQPPCGVPKSVAWRVSWPLGGAGDSDAMRLSPRRRIPET